MTFISDTLNTVFLWYGAIMLVSAARGAIRSTRESAEETAARLKGRFGHLFGERDTTGGDDGESEPEQPAGQSETPLADALIARRRAAERAEAEAAVEEDRAAQAAGDRRRIHASDILYGFAATVGWTLGEAARLGWCQAEDAHRRRLERRAARVEDENTPQGSAEAGDGESPSTGTTAAAAPDAVEPEPYNGDADDEPEGSADDGILAWALAGPDSEPAGAGEPSPAPGDDSTWLEAWGLLVAGAADQEADETTSEASATNVRRLSLVPDPPEELLMSAADVTSLESLYVWTAQSMDVMEMEAADARAASGAAAAAFEMTAGTGARIQRENQNLDVVLDILPVIGVDPQSIAAAAEWRERHGVYQQRALAFAQGFLNLVELGRLMAEAAESSHEGAATFSETLHRHQDAHLEAAQATGHSGAHGGFYGVTDTRSAAALPSGS